MTEYLNTVTNPAAPWSFIDDTEENILQDLAAHTLDPIFELYGDFVNPSPEWLSTENAAKYAGCTMISGNFRAYTHAFRLVTDDAALIARISAAVQRNKSRPEYQEARRKMIDDLPALTFKNAAVGHYYRFCDGWFRLTKIIHLTEEDCNRDSLLYMDRYEGTDWNGHAIGGAFHDGREMPTSANWSIYAAPKEIADTAADGQALFPLA